MARQGIYDTQGELFGYLDGDTVYDLNGGLTGEIRRDKKRRAIYSLDGEKIWHLSGDGVFSLKWEPIGYLGSPYREQDSESYDSY